MATREETRARREALKAHLREISAGAAGDARPAPTVRELAARWNLSVNLVLQAQRELVAEGILHVAPRVGTFVGQPTNADKLYLLVFSEPVHQDAGNLLPRAGFEDRLAALGGAVLTLHFETAAELLKSGALDPVSGVFDYTGAGENGSLWLQASEGTVLPRVRFGSELEHAPNTDFVCFEDERGGWQAAKHLLARKHERIAFLGFHAGEHGSPLSRWSYHRQQGWARALQEAGKSTDGLFFQPSEEHLFFETAKIREASGPAIEQLLVNRDITAVVTANDTLANFLLNALSTSSISPENWPSIVSFDGGNNLDSHILTSLRMPWYELGREAAELLWSRSHQLIKGPSQHRQIPMRLIPRLTCHSGRGYAAAHLSLSGQLA